MTQIQSALFTLRAWLATRVDSDRERGAAMVEYGLLVGLIAVASVGIIFTLGGAIADMFQEVVDNLD